jgi:hypothetical protein
MEWKWSKGDIYYKSARPLKQNTDNSSQNITNSSQNAINQSLADDSFFNQDNNLINITNAMFSRNQNPNGTRREDLDTKIADREMIAQRGVNPFLQTNYVNDITNCDTFLKPINTNKLKN